MVHPPPEPSTWSTQSTLIRNNGPKKPCSLSLTNLKGNPDVAGQALVGEHVAARLAHVRKIASVVSKELITRTSERVARSHGANLKLFAGEDEAVSWLLGFWT